MLTIKAIPPDAGTQPMLGTAARRVGVEMLSPTIIVSDPVA
jgi:hypothetical protein